MKRQMNRWQTGLDKEVLAIRAANRERIIKELIKKLTASMEEAPNTSLKKVLISNRSMPKFANGGN